MAVAVLAIAAVAIVAAIVQSGDEEPGDDPVRAFREARAERAAKAAECEAARNEIRDLEYEHRNGNLPPTEFEERRDREVRRAAVACAPPSTVQQPTTAVPRTVLTLPAVAPEAVLECPEWAGPPIAVTPERHPDAVGARTPFDAMIEEADRLAALFGATDYGINVVDARTGMLMLNGKAAALIKVIMLGNGTFTTEKTERCPVAPN